MPNQVTVTAKTGPGLQVTSVVFLGVNTITFDFAKRVVKLEQGGEVANPIKEFDLTGVTTITDAITGNNHVLVIS